jgi:hypothetical protein
MLAMMGAATFAPIALIAIFSFGTAEAERWLATEHAEHRAQLETLRSGQWPDSAAGRKISALAERLGPDSAARVRRYWELQAWLVAEAEQAMIDEAAGEASIQAERVRAAFAELAGLRQALGRSSFTAMNALLPFSRNDAWEVSELRQRLTK